MLAQRIEKRSTDKATFSNPLVVFQSVGKAFCSGLSGVLF
jgi:hypothetical protein